MHTIEEDTQKSWHVNWDLFKVYRPANFNVTVGPLNQWGIPMEEIPFKETLFE